MKQYLLLQRPKMKVYLALLVVVVGCMVWLGRCAGRSGASGLKKSGGDTLDIAVEYSPLSLYVYDDTLGGFNHDLILLISRQQGIPVKMHPVVTLHESLRRLDEGFYDIVAAQVPVTTDFWAKYLFSDSIYLDRQVLVQRKDSLGNLSVRSQLDIGGKTLTVVEGSPVVTRIANFTREIGDTIYVSAEKEYGQEQLVLMVAAGEIEYAVVSDKIARSMASSYPKLDIGTAVSFNQFQSWVLKKDNVELCNKLDCWLKEARSTAEYKELLRRYFE